MSGSPRTRSGMRGRPWSGMSGCPSTLPPCEVDVAPDGEPPDGHLAPVSVPGARGGALPVPPLLDLRHGVAAAVAQGAQAGPGVRALVPPEVREQALEARRLGPAVRLGEEEPASSGLAGSVIVEREHAESAATAGAAFTAFERKWTPRCPGVVRSLQEGGEELLAFFAFAKSQWRTPRTTNVVEQLHEEFRRRVKTQGSLPTEDAALVLLFGLVASGQIRFRRLDGWRQIPAVLREHHRRAA